METRKAFCKNCIKMCDHTLQPVINNVEISDEKYYVYIQKCTECKKSTNIAIKQ